MKDEKAEDAATRQFAEKLKAHCMEKNLTHAACYFEQMSEHFVAQAARARQEDLAPPSPFIYTMQ